MRRDGYPPLLPRAQTLQGLIHPLDHIPQANVRVIRVVAPITDEKKKTHGGFILITFWGGMISPQPPGVEGRAVLEGAVVVVADEISDRCPARAPFRHFLHLHPQVIFGIEHVNQQHVKHQRGLRRHQGP